MWIVSEHGFISVVQDKNDADLLQVRGRDPQDIRAHFPAAEVYTASGADYRYRARVPRDAVSTALAEMTRHIGYTSHFKDHAILTSPPNSARTAALYGVWHALAELQDFRPYSRVPRSEEPVQWWDEDER